MHEPGTTVKVVVVDIGIILQSCCSMFSNTTFLLFSDTGGNLKVIFRNVRNIVRVLIGMNNYINVPKHGTSVKGFKCALNVSASLKFLSLNNIFTSFFVYLVARI